MLGAKANGADEAKCSEGEGGGSATAILELRHAASHRRQMLGVTGRHFRILPAAESLPE